MVASVVSAQMGGDSGDGGYFWAEPVIPTAYIPGEIMPAEAGDSTAPVVSNVTPATGGALAALDEWGCDVTDADSGVAGVTIFRGGEGARRIEVIYETSIGAARGYTVVVTSITDGYRYRVRAEDGWPRVTTVYVKAVDASGNEATVET